MLAAIQDDHSLEVGFDERDRLISEENDASAYNHSPADPSNDHYLSNQAYRLKSIRNGNAPYQLAGGVFTKLFRNLGQSEPASSRLAGSRANESRKSYDLMQARKESLSREDGQTISVAANNDISRPARNHSPPALSFGVASNGRKLRLLLTVILIFFLLAISIFILLANSIGPIKLTKKSDNRANKTLRIDPPDGWKKQTIEQELKRSRAQRWLLFNSKCHIPILDPWDKSIEQYVERKPPLDCRSIARKFGVKQQSLTYVRDNRLFFTKEAIRREAASKCCYSEILRGQESDDEIITNSTCQSVKTIIESNRQRDNSGWRSPMKLLKIQCNDFNYTNYHSFIVHDIEDELALAKAQERKLDLDRYYNVVLVGVDTISRLNGIRQLEKTLSILRKQYDTIEFKGYNKVGENTFPNLVPFLAGLTPEQLTKVRCWLPSNYTDEGERGDDYLDNCKFLWNFYQDFGYATYFSEDWPKASTFNYLKPGFRQEPTNYYGRPYTLARDSILLPPVGMGCADCILDEPIVSADLERLKGFIKEFQGKPHFAFQWINCPQHDDLNGASKVDHIIEHFFKDIHKLTQDDRTFVIFFSDHGYRWNNFVSTHIGHYESSLPMLTIAPPKRFIKHHPNLYKNLKKHQSSLLTPFDAFKTLMAIRNLGSKKEISSSSSKPSKQIRRNALSVGNLAQPSSAPSTPPSARHGETTTGKPDDEITASSPTASATFKQLPSLDGSSFRQQFTVLSMLDNHTSAQLDRSCIEAGIPDNYCVCHQFRAHDVSARDVLGAAYYLVYVHLYEKLRASDYSGQCSLLELEKINHAEDFDFGQMQSKMKKMKTGGDGRRRRAVDFDDDLESRTPSTTPSPTMTSQASDGSENLMPVKEFNVRFTTQPGGGLYQEVVRFYGNNMAACEEEIEHSESWMRLAANSSGEEKRDTILDMNKVCKFSVHSDSISRLNLYKDQSKCVKNNIELKKICYCKNLLDNKG